MNLTQLYLRLTYDFWRRALPRYGIVRSGAKVLECGIGSGTLLRLMAKWFPDAELFGLDLDGKAVARAGNPGRNFRLMVASAESLPFQKEKFDIVISLHMIEHLARPEEFLWEAARVLRPGGMLSLATPNPNGLGARLLGRRWRGWHPEHISLKPPEVWQRLLTEQGLTVWRGGTTGLSGIPIFQKFPLGLFNWGPLFLFGFFPWNYGESYICLARKTS